MCISFFFVGVISRYGHGFEMFCLASDSARTVVASACKVSVIRQQRPALPDTAVIVQIQQKHGDSTVVLSCCALVRLWFSDLDFDSILVHELTQFLIISLQTRGRSMTSCCLN